MVEMLLPPEGFLASSMANLTLLFAAKYHSERGLKVWYKGRDVLEFEGNAPELCRSLQAAYVEILEESPKQPAPRMHQNDRGVFAKIFGSLGMELRRESPYHEAFTVLVEVFSRKLEDPEECREVARELATGRITAKGIELGSKVFAPLQIFKVEKYEYGKDYMRLAGLKADLMMSPAWISLAAAGWLAAYMGNPGVLVYSLPPDEYMVGALEDAVARETILRPGRLSSYWDYYSAPSKMRFASGFQEAYQLLLALNMPLGDLSLEAGLPPFRVLRVAFDGRRFTVVEDAVLDMSRVVAFARRISVHGDLEAAVRRLAECALQAYAGRRSKTCADAFGDLDTLVRMVKILYSAVMGGVRPETAVYMLARLSPQPVGERLPPFRKPWILRELMEAIQPGLQIKGGN